MNLDHYAMYPNAPLRKLKNKTILKPTVYRNISKGQKH